jgi:hypothetical protein
MRLPRMTVRRWMLAVAIVAVVVSVWRLCWSRHRRFSLRAAIEMKEATRLTRLAAPAKARAAPEPRSLANRDAASEEGEALELAIHLIQSPAFAKGLAARMLQSLAERGMAPRRDIAIEEARARLHMRLASKYQRRAEYHAILGRKYQAAAARPWLSVEPGPPPPD